MQDPAIRPADAADCTALAAIWFDGWHEAHASLLPAALVRLRTRESFETRMRAALAGVRTAGPLGHPVGFSLVKHDELYQLYVRPDARGGHVARTLLADAEEAMARSGVTTAWLSCAIGNLRAARFYEKAGWRLARTIVYTTEAGAGTFDLEVWRYEKMLGLRPVAAPGYTEPYGSV